MIRITAKKDGFRRGGVAHPSKPTIYPDDFFTEKQLAQITEEPMLMVEIRKKQLEPEAPVEETPEPEAPVEEQPAPEAPVEELPKTEGAPKPKAASRKTTRKAKTN